MGKELKESNDNVNQNNTAPHPSIETYLGSIKIKDTPVNPYPTPTSIIINI